MQKFTPHERAGRWKLVSLMALLLLVCLASNAALYAPFTGLSPAALPWLLLTLSGSLFLAVVLWGLFRGSFPALVIFVIFTVQRVGGAIGYIQFHGQMDSIFALDLIQVLLRVTIVLMIFRHEDVADFWQARQRVRTRRWLIWEGVALGALVLGYLLLWVLLSLGL